MTDPMTAPRDCRPPELRDRDGWHWVAKSQREISAYWTAHDQWWDTVHSSGSGPAFAGSGYRYLAPVAPPAVVAALVEALEGWTNALDAKREFERQSPGNSTKAWDRLFYAVEAAETEARAALTLYREAGR